MSRERNLGKSCSDAQCERPAVCRGMCNIHYHRRRRGPRRPMPTLTDRFWSKVDKNGPVPAARPDLGPCWLWTRATHPDGYGNIRVSGRGRFAHRLAYELEIGPVPEGLELDHLCRVRICVNPDHLEPVTHAENMRRGSTGILRVPQTHCVRGHPFDEQNTRWSKGRRICRACSAAWERSHRVGSGR